MRNNFTLSLFFTAVILSAVACHTTKRLVAEETPREAYTDKITSLGGANNPTIKAWRNAGEFSLNHPFSIPNNYDETGRYNAGDSTATSFLIPVRRGQKLTVSFQKSASTIGSSYLDLWHAAAGNNPQLISADTANNLLQYIAEQDENIIARFQGEINFAGNYSLSVQTGPSLLWPIPTNIKAPVIGNFGDPRDSGKRKHEGMDIMPPKHSPAIAAAGGVITETGKDSLGGKVVSMQPDGMNVSLYYAHLDSQFVQEGQRVTAGEVLGLTGNTGDAKNTVSHLHFGVYAGGVAIDPLPFIKPIPLKKPVVLKFPAYLSFSVGGAVNIYAAADKVSPISVIVKGSVITLNAVSADFYRVSLTDGRQGFILKSALKL